ncbi:MAG: ATP-binding cassette domain-containing protein [Pirellulaceae bacterium]|nr:ATP-binding cassette domain-containing protein [Pirellulaceae bacterium]
MTPEPLLPRASGPPAAAVDLPTLTTLTLVERLAAQAGVPFDRAKARVLVSEHLSQAGPTPAAALDQLRNVLGELGLLGRLRQLKLSEALDACRRGEQLVAAVPDLDGGGGAWVLLRSGTPYKVRLAAEQGSDVWITVAQLAESLAVNPSDGAVVCLLVESALPCSPAVTQAPAAAGHASGGHGHHVSHMKPLRRLMAILKPEARDIWVVSVFSAVVGILALATPITVEALVNTVAFGRLLQPVVVLSLVLLGFLGFVALIRVLQTYIAEIIQRRLFVRVVADLSQRLPQVRQDAYEGVHGPELLNRFFDVMTVQKSAALLVLDGIAIILQTAVGMAVLAFYHPLLLGFDVALLAALAFVVFVLGRGGVPTSIEESRAKYAVAAWLEQLAHCPLTFKNSGGPDRAIEHADNLAIEYLRSRQRHFQVLLRQIAFTLSMQALAGSLLLGVGGWLVIEGKLTLGQLVAAELIVALIMGSFSKLGKHLEAYYDLLAAVDKLGHLFDLPIESRAGENLAATERGLTLKLAGHIIGPGELVAIVGPPGAGKTRLLASAFGLGDRTERDSAVEGIDVGALDLGALRSQLVLLRDCEIFTGTVAENVHLSRAAGTRSAVRTCLEELGLRDDLRRLPAGLDTIVQPGGRPLTDSQARRVVLARGLLSQPRALLIDGLLDGLPDDVLPEVIEALGRRLGETTIVIATGRRDVARLCERVIPLAAPAPPAASSPHHPANSHPH